MKAQRIHAGISYWGSIGYITPRERFDKWLERKIKNGAYTDLPSLANYLATEMNKAASDKPIPDPSGLHVAGIHRWSDGNPRPTLFHVHNGHGQMHWKQEFSTANGQPILLRTQLTYEGEPRRLFVKHNDFPREEASLENNLLALDTGYITRNGSYSEYIVIAQGIDVICRYLNTFPNVSVPRKSNSIGVRVGFLKLVMETVINIYKCSSMPEIIGGKVSTLGIKSDGAGPQARPISLAQ